jgi:putative colanic acid biosynthesis UDP-glucose lipid carrier transferase
MNAPGILKSNAPLFRALSHLLDPLVIAGASLIICYGLGEQSVGPHTLVKALAIYGPLFALLVFPAFRLYRAWRGEKLTTELVSLFWAWLSVLLLINCFIFLLANDQQRAILWPYGLFQEEIFFYWAFFCLVLMGAVRLLVRLILRSFRRKGYNHRTVAIVGAGPHGREVASVISKATWTGLKITAFFDDNEALQGRVINNIPVLGGYGDIAEAVADNQFDQLWITLPLKAEEQVKGILHALRYLTIDIRFVPDISGLRLLNHGVTEIVGIPVIDISTTRMDGINLLIKAIEDRLLALIILLLISPLMVIIALGIKCSSPCPILFKQKRHGGGGKEIEVWKFRSMKIHREGEGKVTQATKGDTRVTRLGAFLRRTSLDELPQFINVLQGRMSIVGPRPHAVEHNEYYKEQIWKYMQRHKVKPGITGWAQVNGLRGETETLEKMEKRVEFDLYYIENWSLWFDLKIIFMTILRGFTGSNAY